MPVVQTLVELPGLVENLLLLLSDKEKIVIKKRFNLDGGGKQTLEQIGKEFAVTRERVRQIEKNALGKMKRNVFNTPFANLNSFVSEVVTKNGGLCRTSSLVNELEEMVFDSANLDEGALNLAFSLHDNLDSVGNTINFHPYLRDKGLPDFSLKHASNKLVNQMHKYGDVKGFEAVVRDLEPVLNELELDELKLKSLVDIDKRVALIDDERVALLEWRHVHPRTLRDKILFVLRNERKALHFMEIAEKIKSADFDSRPVNLQAVHNELIRHESFVLIGRGIYALADWGYERGTVVEVVEKILKDKNELSQEEIVEMVLAKRQVKKITIMLALKNSDKFERVGRKRYKLKS